MPNQEEETRKAVAEREVSKVHGQPTNQDFDLLENELLRIASSIYSELGGGAHGHAGLLLSDADYHSNNVSALSKGKEGKAI